MTRVDHVREHLSPLTRMFLTSRRRLRKAIDRARSRPLSEASFCEFMDAVAPGWREGR